MEYWRDLPGYRVPYRIGRAGEVQRQEEDGTWADMKPHRVNGGRPAVTLRRVGGGIVIARISSLMADAFLGGREGINVLHRNGILWDNRLENLDICRSKAETHRYRDTARRPVRKVDREGNVVAFYSSVDEAAEENYMSPSTVIQRCRGRVKEPYTANGCTFEYDT